MKKIIAIIGARPQFIKHIAIEKAFENHFYLKTIHTGQHYDKNLSDIFFKQLQINKPDFQLFPDSNSSVTQLAEMLKGIGDILSSEKPDYVLVYGDTNSTIAGAIAAEKLQIPIIHVEAGLRSYNRNMPEEINRVLTDKISSYLFTPNKQSINNLKKENVKGNIHNVGDVMKDCVFLFKDLKTEISIPENFVFLTIHRNYNTSSKERLHYILENVNNLHKKVIFPIHPRTKNLMNQFGLQENKYNNIDFTPPLSYFDSLQYLKHCNALITDSGGMQKEAYFLKKRCITVRSETEWTETLIGNWNQLCYDNLEELNTKFDVPLTNYNERLYGDGNTAKQIVKILL